MTSASNNISLREFHSLNPRPQKLIALIEPGGTAYAKLAEKAKTEMNMPKPTLTRYLKRLVEAKRITKDSTQFGDVYKAADKPF